jgi:inhibitor of the pro-sigma K processing machinery
MKDFMLNFLLRAVFGAIGIYAVNILLSRYLGLEMHLGLNPLNLLTIGTLGISGFGLVLAVSAFSIL